MILYNKTSKIIKKKTKKNFTSPVKQLICRSCVVTRGASLEAQLLLLY